MRGPIVITGGGTGGHVFAMEAIAERLLARGVAAHQVRYVGSRRGQEATLLAGGPVALTLLPGRGIRRSWSARAVRENVGAVGALVGALLVALVEIGRWRPRAVVSVGGYASFAVALAAVCWRRPLVLVELDAAPGLALRVLRRFAAQRCRAFGPDEPSAVVTGAPIRDTIAAVDRSHEARVLVRSLQIPPIEPQRSVIVVMTGSLGATRVNQAVSDLAWRWADRADRTIIHVTGRRDFELVTSRRPSPGRLDYRIVDFADMTDLWALADVAVCRAGSATLAELTALSIPSILVPLPGMAQHQSRNAYEMVRSGAARLIVDADCDAVVLARVLDEALTPITLTAMADAAGRLARPAAADAIAAVVCGIGDAWRG